MNKTKQNADIPPISADRVHIHSEIKSAIIDTLNIGSFYLLILYNLIAFQFLLLKNYLVLLLHIINQKSFFND